MRRKFSRALSFVVLFFVSMVCLPGVSAQVSPCDPTLKVSQTDQYGYRLRGDRCEGRYIQEVANTVLSITSLTESFEQYDLDSGKDLHIEWMPPPFPAKSLQIRAQSLKDGLFYQMDASPPVKKRNYRWPISLLKALDISQNNIGVLGWTWDMRERGRKIYLPLRIKQQQPSSRPSPCYQVTLWPGRELSEVYVTLAPVVQGNLGPLLKDEEPLEWNYYPAMRRITVPLPILKKPGLYYLNIAATQEIGGSVEVELYFYHAG